jgi:cytochrome P450
MRDPYAWYERTSAEFGPTFSARALNGDLVITGDPVLVKDFFAATEDDVKQFGVDAAGPVLGERSVLLSHGDPHRRSRRLLMPAFSGERMRNYGERMRAIADELSDGWRDAGEFSVHEAMLDISLRIIVEVIFGAREDAQVARLVQLTTTVLEKIHPAMLFARKLQFGAFGLSPWDKFLRARAEYVEALQSLIDARRAEDSDGEDILSVLLRARDDEGHGMDDEDMIQQLVALLIAGHETTSIAMSWSVYWLCHTPAVDEQLANELSAHSEKGQDLSELHYLGLVTKETLRMWPIVPDVLRTLKRPFRLGSIELPAGMSMAASPAITHYDPELYPSPHEFRPERFETFQPRPWEYYPFGGGIRRCIGAPFATFEMAQVLGTVLRKYRFELADSSPVRPVRRNITLAPAGGVRARVIDR